MCVAFVQCISFRRNCHLKAYYLFHTWKESSLVLPIQHAFLQNHLWLIVTSFKIACSQFCIKELQCKTRHFSFSNSSTKFMVFSIYLLIHVYFSFSEIIQIYPQIFTQFCVSFVLTENRRLIADFYYSCFIPPPIIIG